MAEHIPGFSLRLEEDDARQVASGQLPDRVRDDVAEMLSNYDAHLRAAEQQLAKRTRKKSA
jgi:hypothetical protein